MNARRKRTDMTKHPVITRPPAVRRAGLGGKKIHIPFALFYETHFRLLHVRRLCARHVKSMLLPSILCASIMFLGCTKTPVDESSRPDADSPVNVPDIYKPFWRSTLPSADGAAVLAALPFERVALERRASMTTAPNYRVVFHRSGLAELDDKGGPSIGRFTSYLDSSSYARLCYLIERSHFGALRPNYDIGFVTDQETVVVTVVSSSGEHTVSEYGLAGPIELWTIQQTIDGLRAQTLWQPAK
jgi:hypothetical protein